MSPYLRLSDADFISGSQFRLGANRVGPGYNEVGTDDPGRAGSRADIEARLPPPQGPALLDVSLTHPRAGTYVTDAATMQGSAAAKRDALKYRGHNGHYHPGHTFIPASVETYGYLGKPLVRYLNTLSGVAAVWPDIGD